MTRKTYKHHKKGSGQFVRLPEWLQNSEAWASMKPGPRALYIEIKRRFNGNNNGKITLSHREAARLLNVTKNTVGPYFAELDQRGFIHATRGACLGPSGVGETSHWALDEEAMPDGRPARKAFMKWKKN